MNRHYVEGDELRVPSWLAIRDILMDHWDPIGVSDAPEAADEYDSYIPKIKALIRSGASETIVARYLDDLSSNHMGIGRSRTSTHTVALYLVDLRSHLEPL